MPSVHKGGISYRMIYIPVSLYTATQDNDIRFNQLCKDDRSRVRYKKVCSSCNKEVSDADIIKGYEYADGKYVTVSDAEFEAIKTEKDRNLEIDRFVDLDAIPPVYFDKTYHALPEAGSEKAYELLRVSLLELKKVGIARSVIGKSEKLLALIPSEQGILVNTLFFYDEVKNWPKEYSHPEITKEERQVGKMLIQSAEKPFEPEIYHDEFQARLRELIETKKNGKEIVQASQAEGGTKIIDVMEAFKRSLSSEENEPPKKPRGRKKKSAS